MIAALKMQMDGGGLVKGRPIVVARRFQIEAINVRVISRIRFATCLISSRASIAQTFCVTQAFSAGTLATPQVRPENATRHCPLSVPGNRQSASPAAQMATRA